MSKKKAPKQNIVTVRKPQVTLPKYFKRIVNQMKNIDTANKFKNLILEAMVDEKTYKETSRKAQEKNSSD